MSKTEKGNKGPGYEYWSKRNYKDQVIPGKKSKEITNRAANVKINRKRKKMNDDNYPVIMGLIIWTLMVFLLGVIVGQL